MGRNFILVLIVLAVLMVITDAANVRPFFIVKETERALLLRFGEVVRADIAPGLHFKIPNGMIPLENINMNHRA